MMLYQIQDKYADKAVRFGSQFLLRPKDAIEYLNDCVVDGFKFEGVEGFLTTENGAYQPSQEDSNDFVDLDCTREEFVKLTKLFIAERSNKNILFEVVFSE